MTFASRFAELFAPSGLARHLALRPPRGLLLAASLCAGWLEPARKQRANPVRVGIVTSGTGLVTPGRIATEDDAVTSTTIPRVASEEAAALVAGRGVRISVVRLPPSVHGEGDHAFVPALIGMAREKGISAYVGDGHNRWPAVHRLDAAELFRLVLEKGVAGARYHGVAEEGVPFREIAGTIGVHLNVPVVGQSPDEAAKHFEWFVHFAALDNPASSRRTREVLGWQPKQPGLIADLDRGHYFARPERPGWSRENQGVISGWSAAMKHRVAWS